MYLLCSFSQSANKSTLKSFHFRSSMCSILSIVSSDTFLMLSFDSSSLHRSIIYRSILSRICFSFSHLMAPYSSTRLFSVLAAPPLPPESPFRFISSNFSRRVAMCYVLVLGSMHYSPIILPSSTLRTRWERYLRLTSWVTITRVIFSVWFSRSKMSSTICVFLVSRSPVGSSSSKT